MNRSACLIFNPVSGQGNPERDLQSICQQLEPTFQLEVYYLISCTSQYKSVQGKYLRDKATLFLSAFIDK
jgi:hypothetical protein